MKENTNCKYEVRMLLNLKRHPLLQANLRINDVVVYENVVYENLVYENIVSFMTCSRGALGR